MNRTHLESAVKTLVSKRGYTLFAQQGNIAAPPITASQAAMLAPLSLRAVEGRRHGRITYDLTLTLCKNGAKYPPAERATLLASLEDDLLKICTELSDDARVVAIETISIRPSPPSVGIGAELAQTVTAHIITCF